MVFVVPLSMSKIVLVFKVIKQFVTKECKRGFFNPIFKHSKQLELAISLIGTGQLFFEPRKYSRSIRQLKRRQTLSVST